MRTKNDMLQHMIKIMAVTIMEGFTYKQGFKIFTVLALIMEDIDKNPDADENMLVKKYEKSLD